LAGRGASQAAFPRRAWGRSARAIQPGIKIVPTLPRGNAARDAPRHLCAIAKTCGAWRDAERPRRHSHAERGDDQWASFNQASRSFPRSRVGMQPVMLRVARAQWPKPAAPGGTRSVPGGIPTQSVGTISARQRHVEDLSIHKAYPKLWKTNPAQLQSATYSRRKSLFCHTFDLSPSTVEPAVGNVGVAR